MTIDTKNDSDKVMTETAGTLFFDSRGCGPTEGSVTVRAMVTCGEPRVGLMGKTVGGWYLLPVQARAIALALLAAADEAEADSSRCSRSVAGHKKG